MVKIRVIVGCLVLAAGSLTISSARADMYFPFVRITCTAKAGYAAIETLGIYNIDPDQRAMLRTDGFQELGAAAKNPVTCELPQGRLYIEVLNYHAPQLEGMCGQVEDGDLKVSLAGKEIAYAQSMHGGCTGFRRHDIRITEYSVQHCIMQFTPTEMIGPTDFTPVDTECKTTWLH